MIWSLVSGSSASKASRSWIQRCSSTTLLPAPAAPSGAATRSIASSSGGFSVPSSKPVRSWLAM